MIKIANKNNRFSFEVRAPLLLQDTSNGDSQENYKVKPHLPFLNIFKSPYLKATIFLTTAISLFNFSYNGILLFLPKFLQVERMEDRYFILGLQQASGMVGLIIATYMVDSPLGRKWTMLSGFVIGGSLILLFMLTTKFEYVNII